MNKKNHETLLPINDKENVQIKKLYKRLLALTNPKSYKEKENLKKAFSFSFTAHLNMRRKSGQPFIIHPLNVAMILAEEMGIIEIKTIAAALLHDVVEDTPITLKEIEKNFGEDIAKTLDGLTKVECSKENPEGIPLQALNFQKLFSFFAENMRVCAIKIADRLDNMRSLEFLPKEKQLKISAETKAIYAPLAHRLGLGIIKTTLEDLYLKHTNPKAYREILESINYHKENKMYLMDEFSSPIVTLLKAHKIKHRIEKRLKSIYSIYNKMKKKNLEFDQIHDIYGLRIILPYEGQEEITKCWQVYGIITKLYYINPGRTKDWISTARSNGYKSLHMTAMSEKGEWVEIQIRSEKMHMIAKKGIAAHWRYKNSGYIESENENYQELMEQISELAKEKSDISQALRDAQLALYEKDIFVFTTDGKKKYLPIDSTVLDFAIETLGEKGVYVHQALIDGKTRPKDYVLKKGEQISEIFIDPSQKLSAKAEALTHTPKTRKIWQKAFLKSTQEERKRGEKVLMKVFKKNEIPFSLQAQQELKYFFKEERMENIFYKIGSQAHYKKNLKNFVFQKKISPNNPPIDYPKNSSTPLLIRGEKSDFYQLASCCGPIVGDELVGIILKKEPMIFIHRTNCSKEAHLFFEKSKKIVPAIWEHADYTFERDVFFTTILSKESKKSILRSAETFDVMRIEFTKKKKTGVIQGSIRFQAQHLNEVNTLIKKLKKIVGIIRVSRDPIQSIKIAKNNQINT